MVNLVKINKEKERKKARRMRKTEEEREVSRSDK